MKPKEYTTEDIVNTVITSTLLDVNLDFINKIKDTNPLYSYGLKNTGNKFSDEINKSLNIMLSDNETLDEFIQFKLDLKTRILSFTEELKEKLIQANFENVNK